MGELETESQKRRSEVAQFLRRFADQLDTTGPVTLSLDGREVVLDPADPMTLKVEGESDWSEGDSQAKQSIELEMVWWRDAGTAEEASLEPAPQR